MENMLEDPKDTKAKRIVVNNFGNISNHNFLQNEVELCKFQSAIKALIRATHCVVVQAIPKSGFSTRDSGTENYKMNESLRNKVVQYADLYMSMEIQHNPKMFTDFSGCISFLKTYPMQKYKQYPLEHNVYGFKSGKTEFTVELLYENSQGHTESNTADTKKISGICQPQNSKNLDF